MNQDDFCRIFAIIIFSLCVIMFVGVDLNMLSVVVTAFLGIIFLFVFFAFQVYRLGTEGL